MSSFPLYDKLAQSANFVIFKPEYNKLVSMTINNLDKDQARIIYALILHYSNISGQLNIDNPSYNGKDNKKTKGILYNFTNLPEDLRSIIIIYILGLTL